MSQPMQTRHLYRSRDNVMLFGVAAGIAAYVNTDPTIVRVLFVVGSLFIPPLPLVYLALALIMPAAPDA